MSRLELSIAWRYLRSRRGSRLLSFISVIAVAGVAVGVSALIIIMGSYQIYSSAKRPAAEKARYYAVSTGKRIGMGLAFLALAPFGVRVREVR